LLFSFVFFLSPLLSFSPFSFPFLQNRPLLTCQTLPSEGLLPSTWKVTDLKNYSFKRHCKALNPQTAERQLFSVRKANKSLANYHHLWQSSINELVISFSKNSQVHYEEQIWVEFLSPKIVSN
jgi:hypothetical protein